MTDESGPVLVALVDAPDVVDGRGVTSAVVLAEPEAVLPEADDSGAVDESLPLVAVVCDPPLAVLETVVLLARDDPEDVWEPTEVLPPEEDAEADVLLEVWDCVGKE
jgi:hypothetical protein